MKYLQSAKIRQADCRDHNICEHPILFYILIIIDGFRTSCLSAGIAKLKRIKNV